MLTDINNKMPRKLTLTPFLALLLLVVTGYSTASVAADVYYIPGTGPIPQCGNSSVSMTTGGSGSDLASQYTSKYNALPRTNCEDGCCDNGCNLTTLGAVDTAINSFELISQCGGAIYPTGYFICASPKIFTNGQCEDPPVTVNVTASPSFLTLIDGTTAATPASVSWSSTGATDCTIGSLSGSKVFGPFTAVGSFPFSVTCSNGPSNSATGVASVTVVYDTSADENAGTPKVSGASDVDLSCRDKDPIMVSNPINVGTGNKYQSEIDFRGAGNDFPLVFQRHYNSHASSAVDAGGTIIGAHWRHNYDYQLSFSPDAVNPSEIKMYRPDGKAYTYTLDSGLWSSASDINGELAEVAGGWQYKNAYEQVELYDDNGKLQQITDIRGNTQTFTYNGTTGLLETVTHSVTGESLTFAYDANSHLQSLTDHTDRIWGYRYDVNNNLEYVDNPDTTSRQYHYEDTNFPNALTGITDERSIRYATWTYDNLGRATSSTHAGNAQYVGIQYAANGSLTRTITNGREVTSTYNILTTPQGKAQVSSISGPGCSTCGAGNTSFSYDAENNLVTRTENNIQTRFGDYDSNGNYGYKIEAAYTSEERRSDYTYDPRFLGKVATITETSVAGGSNNKVTTYAYDDLGNVTSITVNGFTPDATPTPVSRTVTMAYTGPLNQLSQIDGPRTDVSDITDLEYHSYTPNPATFDPNNGRLMKMTGPDLGAPTGRIILRGNIQYTATGKVLSESRANGLSLSYSYYTGNDRLETVTQTVGGVSRVTRWTYLLTGEVETITQAYDTADATTITFGYDDARRLTRITDGLDNYIQYTLDSEGNTEVEGIYDSTNVLHKALNQTFDLYNQLNLSKQGSDPLNPLAQLDYNFSTNGTLDTVVDSKGTTDYDYDALKRLTTVTQDQGGADATTKDALSQYFYDVQDNLTQVIDPVNGTTIYDYDDLGNLLNQTSPDTGSVSNTYDNAGNLKTKTDAKNQLFTYNYDVLNRLSGIDAPGTVDDINYAYDTCSNGSGRLCSVTMGGAITVSYSYNGFGEVLSHQGISYSYDLAERVKTMTYPSGAVVTYSHDTAGQVNKVELTIGATTTTLADTISYYPFGDVKALTYGNGKSLSQVLDTAYRVDSRSVSGALVLAGYDYDGNGNLSGRSKDTQAESYSYDVLNRLDTASGGFGSRDYDYDKNGNRSQLVADTVTTDYSYVPSSNRLLTLGGASIQSDLNGNTTAKGIYNYSFTSHNRMQQLKLSGVILADYSYNGLGQRTRKKPDAGNLPGDATGDGLLDIEDNNAIVDFILGQPVVNSPDCTQDSEIDVRDLVCVNNLKAHGVTGKIAEVEYRYSLTGQLLAELDGNDNVLKEYIYLNGQPLAMVEGSNVYYIHNDHLGTPQVLTNNTGAVVWKASYDPFGAAMVNEDVDGDTNKVSFNLRFPGQYYDGESGLHYNYYRTYDPSLGRYVTSDPIGLVGGLNTYLYANANSQRFVDPFGLDTYVINRDLSAFGDSARSLDNVVTHTFLVSTNPDGSVAHTYSWGNDANVQGWNLDQPLDIKTAQEALDKGYAGRVAPSFLDSYYQKAFDLLNKEENEHSNFILANNCKDEAGKLNELAWKLWTSGLQ